MNPLFPVLHAYPGRPLELPTGRHGTKYNNTASALTKVYQAIVPRGVVWSPNPDGRGLIQLATTEDLTTAGDHTTPEATTYVPTRIPKLDDVGVADGEAAMVALTADGTKRTISAIVDHIDDPSAGTILCSDETAAAHMHSYIPFAAGEIKVMVEVPGSQGEYGLVIYQGDTASLHATNQERRPNRLCWPCHLPPDFLLTVYLNAAWVAAWEDGCTGTSNDIDFARVIFSMIERPIRAFASPGDKDHGLGYILRKQAHVAISGVAMP